MDGALTELAGTAWAAAGEEELLAAARNIEGWSRRLYGVALARWRFVRSHGGQ